jgi:hypothetical protein
LKVEEKYEQRKKMENSRQQKKLKVLIPFLFETITEADKNLYAYTACLCIILCVLESSGHCNFCTVIKH